MKLKTLKDIELPNGCDCENRIRQEAIKWMESDNLIINELKIWFPFTSENIVESQISIRKWIKHFFNISEADLK